ncbi:MAG: NAD-dependent epimerase/dehydratase family protein [Armatimonadetes bacterium]|nr:NAD-dependent epimerase/dehydratase family protein [Armatimonadota bacterium]
MRYFVTGATGFIGGRVVRQLREAAHEVIVLARDPVSARELQALGADVRAGDITDRESLRAPMEGVDGVFHLAGWYKLGVRDTRPGQRINVDGTRNVLETMRDLGIPRGVYTSTVAVFSDTHGKMVDESYHYDGPHLSEYDRTKAAAHYEVADPMIRAGLPLVIVQPGLVYGPGDTSSVRTALVKYLKRQLPMMPTGSAYCWAHVDDIARGHVLAMEKGKPGESYIIAGPRHSFVEAMEMASRISGVPAPGVRVPPAVLRMLAGVMGLVEKFVAVPEEYTAEYLRVNAGVTYLGDNAKARRELGYDPRPPEEGLRETLLHEMHLLGMKPPV